MENADTYWREFLKATGRDEAEKCAGDIRFEARGFAGDELVALTLAGKKTAFFSSYASYAADNEPLPVSGELYVLLDRSETPRCVIELASVQIVPFNEVTLDMVMQDGEDESVEAWRERRREYLEDEGAIVGFEFSETIKLVFQSFRVVYRG